jgi:DNA-binding protein Fis
MDYVARVLQRSDGNVTRAAEDMGISRVALQKKLKDLGLR